jgi:aspartate aminotransferase-like enzyme
MRERLFTPGPTQVPERVQVAMSNPLVHHRGSEFKRIFKGVIEDLKYFFQTEGDVIALTASGTGAMEACVVNILSKNDRVLTVSGGKFGERWGQLCQTYGADAHIMEVPWGQAVNPSDIKSYLEKHSETAAVFLTHSETSTGVAADIQSIAEIVRNHPDTLLVVDAITSAGVLPFKMQEWGIDVAVTGSQKGLMCPPGLAAVALNDRAWQKINASDISKFYFDLLKEKKAQENMTSAWTPGITLFMGLREALKMIRDEGLENMWQGYELLAHATREAVKAVGLDLFAQFPSNSLTAVKLPESIDGVKFKRHLREKYGITVAGGQAQLKGKIIRIAHMGYCDTLDMVAMVSALELALADFGWEFKHGEGVFTIQNIFMKSKK